MLFALAHLSFVVEGQEEEGQWQELMMESLADIMDNICSPGSPHCVFDFQAVHAYIKVINGNNYTATTTTTEPVNIPSDPYLLFSTKLIKKLVSLPSSPYDWKSHFFSHQDYFGTRRVYHHY